MSSEKTRVRIDNGDVRELGKNEGINTEVLLDLNPDALIGYGVSSSNKTLETIKNSGILHYTIKKCLHSTIKKINFYTYYKIFGHFYTYYKTPSPPSLQVTKQ